MLHQFSKIKRSYYSWENVIIWNPDIYLTSNSNHRRKIVLRQFFSCEEWSFTLKISIWHFWYQSVFEHRPLRNKVWQYWPIAFLICFSNVDYLQRWLLKFSSCFLHISIDIRGAIEIFGLFDSEKNRLNVTSSFHFFLQKNSFWASTLALKDYA